MTGFGRGEASDDELGVQVEIKSVNHRFKDIRFKMSSQLNNLELELKKSLGDRFSRGSFDISINTKRAEAKSRFDHLDETKIEDYLTRVKGIAGKAGVELQVSATEFLRSEFYREQDEEQPQKIQDFVKQAFELACIQLENSRKEEGQKLLVDIQKHVGHFEAAFKNIVDLAGTFQTHVEERLRKRFAEYGKEIQVDEPRFLQEVVFYLEKLDVQEEISRIKAHLSKLVDLLLNGHEVGRQIDFLMQELNRETNTIGSKSAMKEVSDSVVQMKVQLEKIREQGLNLE